MHGSCEEIKLYLSLSNPRSLGYRTSKSAVIAQKLILLNLSGFTNIYNKRVLIIDVSKSIIHVNFHYILRKIVAPKSIKLGIFRCLNSGFQLTFDSNFLFSSLLYNVFLDGLENVHLSSIRFGTELLIFLKPYDDEKVVSRKIKNFLFASGNFLNYTDVKIFSPTSGFNFLDWNFKLFKSGSIFSTPSYANYKNFLKRVKIIINNSNYGAVRLIKARHIYSNVI